MQPGGGQDMQSHIPRTTMTPHERKNGGGDVHSVHNDDALHIQHHARHLCVGHWATTSCGTAVSDV